MDTKKKIFGIIPIKMCLDKRLTLNDLRTYAALSSFQGLKTLSYPSLDKISQRSGIHKSHISKCTRRLEQFGYIRKIRRGKRISNVYEVVDDYAKSAESPKSDYAEVAKNDYADTAKSDYAEAADSNIKTTLKTSPKTPLDGGDYLFKNEFYSITNGQIEEWKGTYPHLKKYLPIIQKTSDMLREKRNKGEKITSPMAFLNKILENENKKASEEKRHSYEGQLARQRKYSPTGESGEPRPVGEILKQINISGSK